MTSVIQTPVVSTHQIEDFLDVVNTAVALVARNLPAHVDRDDLASVGRVKLVQLHSRAPAAFAEARAWLLSRVANAMRDELRRTDDLGRHTRKLLGSIEAARLHISAQGHDSPSDGELAGAVGVSVRVLRRALRVATLDDAHALRNVSDEIVSEDASDPDRSAEFNELAAIAQDALLSLPRSYRIAVAMQVMDGATLAEVAEALGCSVAGAAKYRDRGLQMLRSHPDLGNLRTG